MNIPAWPERPANTRDMDAEHFEAAAYLYQSALAAAWEARCRVLAEVLEAQRKWLLIDEGFARYDQQRLIVEEALKAIGELPSV